MSETCQVLQMHFVCLVKKSEVNDFNFIFKAATVKRKCEGKELEMKNLQDRKRSLEAKRKKMSWDKLLFCIVVSSFCYICISVMLCLCYACH